MRGPLRILLGLGVLVGVSAAAARGVEWAQGDVRWRHVVGTPDSVVLIVTDNVREDHTSLCGYSRPTTPGIAALAQAPGAVHTCRAYAPGSWTLPSHASFFTGLPVTRHGAHEYDAPVDDPSGTGIVTRLLSDGATTLAETMKERGYQTVLLAGNPIVGKRTGLAQGFDVSHTAKRFGSFDADEIAESLGSTLEKLDPRAGPLFLVVNLAEAHRPWKAIPEGHPFLPPREKEQYDDDDPEGEWRTFLEGRMSKPEKDAFLRHVTDVYDYGVQRADAGVSGVMDTLHRSGWCDRHCRVLVTSDHGEFIGEHHLIDHGFYSWEENARVYLVAQGVDEGALPEPLSAMAVYWLARDGKLPDELPAVEQWAWPHVRRALHSSGHAFHSTSVARWTGWTKQLWADGVYYSFDLRTDPGETGGPSPEAPDADFAALRTLLDSQAHREGKVESSVTDALKAAGYLE